MAARPAFALDSHLFFWLTQVMGARDRRLNAELKAFDLRVPEWRALAAIYSRRACTMSELAELASIDRTTLTRTIDRMQESGWLGRNADGEDMRVTRLALTAAGERLFARVWPTVERLNDAALAGLSAAAVERLRATLAQMKANLDEEPAAERAA
ncbi:MAG TPA: MarR family transcriptional regulator [Burkholderiales bacterium]|jgi:DNA-binding MarR family transcriptional regulator|nr:MarR family transcriptional regulator [Burkholderiales bacterium]